MKLADAYARALFAVLSSGAVSVHDAVSRLQNILRTQRREKLFQPTMRALQQLLQQAQRQSPRVTVAHEKACASYAAAGERCVVDETLIGGAIVERQGHVKDTSYKRALLDMYERIRTME